MAIFAHCANLCCPNFCHFLSWYDKAQGPFWSPSFPSSGYVSLIMGSSRFGIRNFKVNHDSNFTCMHVIHSFFVNRMNVIGYGIFVLGSEKDNPNHPNMYFHVKTSGWWRKTSRFPEKKKTSIANLIHAMTDERTRMNLEKSVASAMLSLLLARFPKGYLSSFPE